MKYKVRSTGWPLRKKSKKGFRGYPVATVAFYGPPNTFASKTAIGIVASEGATAKVERWFSQAGQDVRFDPVLGEQVSAFVKQQGAVSVVMTDRIIGCPHEEGIDYPDDSVCPQCPYWAGRDRFTHELI
jgi:hypothetical protein